MVCRRVVALIVSSIVCLLHQSTHCAEIINGKVVTPHSMPFMALLQEQGSFQCGGTLIGPKWVLTAAHCEKIDEVILGVHSIKNTTDVSRQTLKVKRKIPHPCYDKSEMVHDLMLLQLKKASKPTRQVRFLPLSFKAKDDIPAGSSCLVAGWGQTDNRVKHASDVLMCVNVTVIDRMKCNSAQYYYGEPAIVTKSMICAGSDGKNMADTCKGDSGGPLLCDGELVGVTSWGAPGQCGVKNKPGVYTFLTEKHLEWIQKTMKKHNMEDQFD